MNIIDIIICICFAISIYFGLKKGATRQLCSLVGVIIAIILAKTMGSDVAKMLSIKGDYATIWGYIIIFLLALIATGIVSHLLRKIIKFAGLGSLDHILGVVISAVKCTLLLAVTFILINTLGEQERDGKKEKSELSKTIESSALYNPIASTAKYIHPSIKWIEEQIPQTNSNKDKSLDDDGE